MPLHPFLLPLLVGFLCEVTKIAVDVLRTGAFTGGLFRAGGMPSSHSAITTSLLIVVGKVDGVDSTAFAIAATLACIVWYDASHSRREVGQLARVINHLQKKETFNERTGHTLVEVLAGIAFGGILTCTWFFV
jgi:acid phosphatase family membrane protein YuiD